LRKSVADSADDRIYVVEGFGGLNFPKHPLFSLQAAAKPPTGAEKIKAFWRNEVAPGLPADANRVSPIDNQCYRTFSPPAVYSISKRDNKAAL
jgi:hypothetical protein